MAHSDNSLIAARYARALFVLAAEKNAHDAVKKDLHMLTALISESAELRKFLISPVVSRRQAGEAVESLLVAIKASELTRNFFLLLARERRLASTQAIVDKYLSLLADARGEITVQVTSATALGKEQIATLTGALERSTGKKVEVKTSENPMLLGGIQLRMGSRMLDNTIAGKLSRLKQALTKAA